MLGDNILPFKPIFMGEEILEKGIPFNKCQQGGRQLWGAGGAIVGE